MTKYSGLQFKKFDLHVHTPASYDFPDMSVTPKQIVQEAIGNDLKGIAITDHNTGAWIDLIKQEAKGTELVVFPGVEIYCTGGKEGIHVIGILNINMGRKHIEALLAKLNFNPDDCGTKKAVTELSPYQVINAITSEPFKGIGVLAHCTSTKGVLHDITGLTRTRIFEHPGLLAIESSFNDFTDAEKIRKGTRAIDLLDGNHENFNYKRLGVYISSDSKREGDDEHNLHGIGAKYTYFKVDDQVDLESLRQCFIDRDVRIRQSFEYKENIYPYIKSISINGGFFDGQSTAFHYGLNSILGAKGSGKSLLVELMRFGLNQTSTQKDILEDHKRKLEKKLDTYGSVSIEIVDETDTEHEIERVYNLAENNPYSKAEYENIVNSFPVLFLSQNEIIKIAEDENEQMRFIDRFFDFRHFQNRIKNVERDLNNLDIQFAEGLRSMQIIKDIKAQITRNLNEIDKFNKLLADPIYEKYMNLENKDRALRIQEQSLNELLRFLLNQKSEFEKKEIPYYQDILRTDPIVKRNDDLIKNTKKQVMDNLNQTIEVLENAITVIRNEYKKWNSIFKEEKNKYEEHIRNSGGDKKAIEAQRLRITKDVEDLKKRESLLSEKTNSIKNIKQERDNLIQKLFSIYQEYSEERKAKCEKFEKESDRRLQVKLHESTNIDEFKNQLKQLKKGSYLRDAEIDEICNKITPYEFILALLRYEVSRDTNKLDDVVEKSGIDIERLQSLCDFLLNQVKYEDLLKLQYKAHPQDRPEIKFRVNEKRYELIRDISIGQKCTAMLIMALSDGNFPIVIDQPEDSLDVRSVWDDMCTKIRRGKESRQFIFTTHNSCLAVASDTDKYSIIESDANRAAIVMSGALESAAVKEEVIKYLEGGRPTYQAKASKYGV